MAGIYIHIPFCKKACFYCDFHFSTSLRFKDDMINAILIEIEKQKKYLNNKRLETIYFGGGTPSILTQKEISLIFNSIYKSFSLNDDCEITFEANPDDINLDKLVKKCVNFVLDFIGFC